MNESDPIVDEVRRIRDAHAAKFNYDPDAIFRDIKEQEKRSGRKYVSFADDTGDLAAIQAGIDDVEAGRFRPFTEIDAEFRQKHNLADKA